MEVIEVDRILRRRVVWYGGKPAVEYLIRWKGYGTEDESDDEWYPGHLLVRQQKISSAVPKQTSRSQTPAIRMKDDKIKVWDQTCWKAVRTALKENRTPTDEDVIMVRWILHVTQSQTKASVVMTAADWGVPQLHSQNTSFPRTVTFYHHLIPFYKLFPRQILYLEPNSSIRSSSESDIGRGRRRRSRRDQARAQKVDRRRQVGCSCGKDLTKLFGAKNSCSDKKWSTPFPMLLPAFRGYSYSSSLCRDELYYLLP